MKRVDALSDAPRTRRISKAQIRRMELQPGDLMLVTTQNSVYSIRRVDRDQDVYRISGGWFDRTGQSSVRMTITGCTWDGKIFDRDLLAARGMRLQFDNSVITSAIQNVCLFRDEPSPENRPSTTASVPPSGKVETISNNTPFPWKSAKKPSS